MHSCRSRSSGKLAIEYVLRNSSVVRAAYTAKLAQPSLTKQGEHARYSGLSLRGRRSKGKGKGIMARDHARGRREEGNACKEAIVFAIPPTN